MDYKISDQYQDDLLFACLYFNVIQQKYPHHKNLIIMQSTLYS